MLKDCPLFESYRDRSTSTQYFQMNLITNLKTKEYGNEQSSKY